MKTASFQARANQERARLSAARRASSLVRTGSNGSGPPSALRRVQRTAERGVEPEIFRRLFDSLHDAAMIVGPVGTILRANRRAGRMFGYRTDDLSGLRIASLVPKVRQLWRRNAGAGSTASRAPHSVRWGQELRARRADGSEFPVEVLCSQVRVGSKQFGFAVVRDVTERQNSGTEKQKLLHDLGERVKELRALHALRDILQNANGDTPELLREIADLLPAAWQYPEAAAARVLLGQIQAATSNYARTPWVQRARFSLADGARGMVEVVYLKRFPDGHEGPFLAEERSLIDSVAESLRSFFDHRRVAEELQRSEDRFRRALRHSPIAVFHQDTKMRYTWAYNTNPPSAARKMIGKTDWDLFPREEARLLTRIKHSVIKTGKSEREEVRVTINGNQVCYDLAIEPLHDAARRMTGVTCAAMDITKRKRAETERSFLASIVESSEDAIFVRMLEGTIITWNAGAERMFGYSAQEMMGRSVSILLPPDRLDEVSRINLQVQQGERMEHYETVRLRKDGSQIHVSLTNSPMRGPEGKVDRVSTIARDITKRKQLELEILEINETLQRRVGRDLHDGLSQQLRGIAYLSHVLEQTLAGKSLAEAREVTRINELLTQAISEARGLARGLAPLRLDADGLMSALRELAAGTESIYGIPCRFVCPQPVLISDRPTAIHLYRIVQEAVQNATKHGNPTTIVIDLRRTTDTIRLEVIDDGTGLPGDFVSRGGMGLKIMDYRCKTIGAVLDFRRPAAGGTVLSCSLPAMRWNTRAI